MGSGRNKTRLTELFGLSFDSGGSYSGLITGSGRNFSRCTALFASGRNFEGLELSFYKILSLYIVFLGSLIF